MDVQQTLIEHQDILSTFSNVALDIFRTVGWWIIRGIASLNDAVESAMRVIFDNLDFFRSAEIGLDNGGGLYGSFQIVFWALLTVGLIIIGFLLMTNRLKNRANIPMNIVLVIVMVIGMPTMLNLLSDITSSVVNTVFTDTSFSEDLISRNVYDLSYLDQNDFNPQAVAQRHGLQTGGTVPIRTMINPSEKMNYNNCNNKALFKSELGTDADGNIRVEENANKNFWGITLLDSLYYRWQINWAVLLITSTIMLLAMVMVAIKTSRYIFEIAYNGIFLMLVAPLDISTGQRTKKIIEEIVNLFAVIMFTAILLRFYSIAMSWTNQFSPFAALLFQAGFSGVLIAGPSIVHKVLGISAGVGQELQSMASGMYLASGLGRAAKGAANVAGSAVAATTRGIAGAGVVGAAAAGGVAAGIKNAIADRQNKKGAGATEGEFSQLGSNNGGGSNSGDSPELEGRNTTAIGDGSDPSQDGSNGSSPDMPGGDGGKPVDNTELPFEPKASSTSAAEETESTLSPKVSDASGKDMSRVPAGSNNQAPAAKRVTKEDTIGGALSKLVGNTAPVKNAKGYADTVSTAYQVGKNSADEGWNNYRNQDKPIPHVYAEPVDMNETKPKTPNANEPIIVDATQASEAPRQVEGAKNGLPPKKREE